MMDWLLPCRHKRTTFPITLKGERGAHLTCLDCGRVFEYDWKTMTRGKERTHDNDTD